MAAGYKVKSRGGRKLRNPAALRSKVQNKPRLNSQTGRKAFRTGKN